MKGWAVAALVFCFGLSVEAGEFSGAVVRVADGDTLSIKVDAAEVVRVRLTEIDAPERGQPYSQVARRSLVELCMQRSARVEFVGQDKYGRILGRVYCGGVDANAEQVRRGLAWAFTKYLTDPGIAAIEGEARGAGVGLWRDSNPQAPWEYRAEKAKEVR